MICRMEKIAGLLEAGGSIFIFLLKQNKPAIRPFARQKNEGEYENCMIANKQLSHKQRKSGPPEDKNQYVQQEEEEDAAMDDGVIQSSRSADELEDARDTLKAAKRMRTHRSSANPDSGIAGVIDSVTLVNFMSHRHFKLRFGPRVNFVTGPNGSGKSAILTGITVCMGGRANATNRASNLKGLIREGAEYAMFL